MLNGLLDFGGNDGVGFSVGGGAGIAGRTADPAFGRIRADPAGSTPRTSLSPGRGSPTLRAPDQRFGRPRPQVPLLQRRGSRSRRHAAAAGCRSDLSSHSVLASVLVNFGGAEPSAAPPPPPPPPPPPSASAATGGAVQPRAVHRLLRLGQVDITPEASTILNNAVTAYAQLRLRLRS